MIARGDGYPVHYTPPRSMYSNTNNVALNNMSRYSHYPPTRPMDMNSNGHNSNIFGSPSTWLYDSAPRQSATTNPEAPPFHETTVIHDLLINNQTVRPEITAKIHKGFFQVDSKWTCYRRNYFSLSCSFTLRPWLQPSQGAQAFVQFSNGAPRRVKSFAMAISAVVSGQDSEIRELVQHTPKRDKQSERKPDRIVLEPMPPPSLTINPGQVPNGHHMSFGMPPPASMHFDCGPAFGGHPSQAVQGAPTNHTFERIQFQKATANNGKRRAQQQFYQLVTELYADISDSGPESSPQWVLIAKKFSAPMVVRGRSPGHYKDNGRRDSTTSIGPDSDPGNSADGRLGSLNSSMASIPRPHHHLLSSYDQTQNRRLTSSDQPPLTGSLVSSSSSSPGFDFSMMNEPLSPIETMKDNTTVDAYGHQPYTTASAGPRKPTHEPSGLRNHIPTYSSKQEHHDGTFSESFEPMGTLLHNDNDGNSQYFGRQDDQGLRSGLKYQAPYSHRPTSHGYSRF